MPYRILGRAEPKGRFMDVLLHVNLKPPYHDTEAYKVIDHLQNALKGGENFTMGFVDVEVTGDTNTEEKKSGPIGFDQGMLEMLGIDSDIAVTKNIGIGTTIYNDFWTRFEKWRGLAGIYFCKDPANVTDRERFIVLLASKFFGG